MAALPVIAAIASIGAGAATTYQALKKPKGAPAATLLTTPTPPADATNDQDAEQKRQARARLAQQRSVLSDTKQRGSVLTSGLGSAPTTTKSLLGL